jgi:hypothetical protein
VRLLTLAVVFVLDPLAVILLLAAAYPVAERTIMLASEYAFPLWLAGGQMLRGWARSNLGDVEQGLPEIRKSVRALEATGALI